MGLVNPNKKKILELVEELNNDKDVPRMILTDTKIGQIYHERVNVCLFAYNTRWSSTLNFQSEGSPQSNKITQLENMIQSNKDLFKLNKSFLEDFKNYQILKFNILKDVEVEDKIIP